MARLKDNSKDKSPKGAIHSLTAAQEPACALGVFSRLHELKHRFAPSQRVESRVRHQRPKEVREEGTLIPAPDLCCKPRSQRAAPQGEQKQAHTCP